MSEWQPIESAPRDRRILLWSPTFGGRAIGGRYDDDKYASKPRPYWTLDNERICGVSTCRAQPPTHWQPLPEPPNAQ